MNKIFLLAFLCVIFFSTPNVKAESPNVPHILSPGDVLSADVLNEIFIRVGDTVDGFSEPSELVGIWSCTMISSDSDCISSGIYTTHSSGLYGVLSDTVTFTDDGDGTYSYEANNYSLYLCVISINDAESGDYTVINNRLITKKLNSSVTFMSTIEKISKNKFLWNYTSSLPPSRVIVCDKQNLPPSGPTQLSVELSGKTVSLSWTDNSSDETAYKVLRRDELTGAFNEITSLSANVTTYSETLSANGKYWYRVEAINSNGASYGSNVVKVTIE